MSISTRIRSISTQIRSISTQIRLISTRNRSISTRIRSISTGIRSILTRIRLILTRNRSISSRIRNPLTQSGKSPFNYSLFCSYAPPTKSPEFGACAQTAISSTNSHNRGGGHGNPGGGALVPCRLFWNIHIFWFLHRDIFYAFLNTYMYL